jgi:tetratricopeptide (TPR) repeat protein
MALVKANALEEGIKLLRDHTTDKPSAHGYCMLADALMQANQFDEARSKLDDAIRLNPSYDEAYFLLGELARDKQPEVAVSYYREAIKRDPDYQIALQRLGSLLIAKSETLSEGKSALERAIELDSEDPWAHLYLANAHWRAGERVDAERGFRRAVELCPNDPFFLRCLDQFVSNDCGWRNTRSDKQAETE